MSENNRFTSKFGKSINKTSFGEIKDNSRFQAEFSNTSGGSVAYAGMITEWTVSDGQTITLEGQIGAGATYLYDVDWGDSQTDEAVTISDQTHTYTSAGRYTVKISGQFAGWRFIIASASDQTAITKFVQWGTETTIQGFYGIIRVGNWK